MCIYLETHASIRFLVAFVSRVFHAKQRHFAFTKRSVCMYVLFILLCFGNTVCC